MTEDERQFHCETMRRMNAVINHCPDAEIASDEMCYHIKRAAIEIYDAIFLDTSGKLNVYYPTSFEWQGGDDD